MRGYLFAILEEGEGRVALDVVAPAQRLDGAVHLDNLQVLVVLICLCNLARTDRDGYLTRIIKGIR